MHRVQVMAHHTLGCYAVVVATSGAIKKTTSGKVQRRACRAAFEAGEYTEVMLLSLRGIHPGGAMLTVEPCAVSLEAVEVALRSATCAKALRLPVRQDSGSLDVRDSRHLSFSVSCYMHRLRGQLSG